MELSLWNRAIIAELVAKTCQDLEFRKAFLSDPTGCLAEAGARLPEDARIVVHENSFSEFNVVLAPFSKDTRTMPFIETPREIGRAFYSLIRKAVADREFRGRLIADPRACAAEAGITIPPGIEVRVFEDGGSVAHVILPVLPPEGVLGAEELRKVAGGAYVVTFDSAQAYNTIGNYSFAQSATTEYTFLYASAMQTVQTTSYTDNAVSNAATQGSVSWLDVSQTIYLATTVEVAAEVQEAVIAQTTTIVEAEVEVVAVAIAAIIMT